MITLFKPRLMILALSAAVTVGCGSTSTNDYTFSQSRFATGLTITPNPVSRDVGQTQQFTATANINDGSTEVVTGLVQWSSSNPAVVTIGSTSGLATAVAPGNVTITAQSTTLSTTASMTVSAQLTNRLYVSNNDGVRGIRVFDVNASGNVAPIRSIFGNQCS